MAIYMAAATIPVPAASSGSVTGMLHEPSPVQKIWTSAGMPEVAHLHMANCWNARNGSESECAIYPLHHGAPKSKSTTYVSDDKICYKYHKQFPICSGHLFIVDALKGSVLLPLTKHE